MEAVDKRVNLIHIDYLPGYTGRRLASMTDAKGLTTTYTYDALGRVIAETKSGGGFRPDTVTATVYDGEDRVLSRTVS